MRLVVVEVNDTTCGRNALRWAAGRALATGASLRIVNSASARPMVACSCAGMFPLPVGRPETERLGRELITSMVEQVLGATRTLPPIDMVASTNCLSDLLATEAVHADIAVVGSPRTWFGRAEIARIRHRLTCPVIIVEQDRPR